MENRHSITVNVDKGAVVTKANALIEASYILSLIEQRLILACAAKLDGRKPMPRDTVFEISADEYVRLFNIDPRNAYKDMEFAVSKLYERDINRIEGQNRKRLRWVYMAEYKKGEGKVRLAFSPDIAPYLTMLNKKIHQLQHRGSGRAPFKLRYPDLRNAGPVSRHRGILDHGRKFQNAA